MNTKIIYVAMVLVMIASVAHGQKLERHTFDQAGGVGVSADFQLHYTLGGLGSVTAELGEIIISGGFIQGSIVQQSTPTIFEELLSLTVSPNPTIDRLRVETTEDKPESKFILYDVKGQELYRGDFANDLQIDMRTFSAGVYFLKWKSKLNEVLGQFKIVKY